MASLRADKVTVTIPHELKEQLVLLKDELKISISAIYKEALESYLKQKEIEKWGKGAQLAAKDKKYMDFVNEISSDVGDLYEY